MRQLPPNIHRSILVLTLIISFAATACYDPPNTPDLPETWQELDPAELYPDFTYKGLKPSCASCPPAVRFKGDAETDPTEIFDSKYTFFVKGGTTNKLVIFFEDGGACWDSMNCLYVHTYSEDVRKVQLESGPAPKAAGSGMFDTTHPDNPFKDWFFVYIPYCTADIHTGTKDTEYVDSQGAYGEPGDTVTLRHRGAVNVNVVMKWVKENFEAPDKIFVTGSSAGSYATTTYFPKIAKSFPDSATYLLADAGNGVTPKETLALYDEKWAPVVPTMRGFRHRDYADIEMDEWYTITAEAFPNSRLAQFTTNFDQTQIFFYNLMLKNEDGDPNMWYPETWQTFDGAVVGYDWHTQMMEISQIASETVPNFKYYIADDSYHMINIYPRFYEEDSTGISFADWVTEMVNDDPEWDTAIWEQEELVSE